MGSQEYGFYFSLFNFTLMLNILLDLGITNYNNRNIAQYNQLLNKHLSNVLSLKIVLFLLYSIVVFILAFIVRYNERQMYMLIFLVFNQFLLSLILYLRSNLSALHLFKTDGVVSVLDRLVMIILCSLLLWSGLFPKPFTIEKFVYAQTVSYVIATIIALIIVLKKSGKIYLNIDWHFFFVFLKKSYPYALLILLMAFYNRIDGVMLERMLDNGKEQAGIYAQSFRILDAASMIAFLFSGLLLPMFSKMIKEKSDVYPLVQLSYKLIILPVIIFIVIAIVYSSEIMKLLYHQGDEYSANVFRILIIGLFATSTIYIYGTLLTANGSMKELNIIAFITMIINIGLNLFLIPQYQARGAAFSSITAQLFSAFAQIFIAMKIFHFKFNKIFIGQFITIFIATIVTALLTRNFIHNWILGSTITFVFGGIMILAIKAFDIKTLWLIFKNKSTSNDEIATK